MGWLTKPTLFWLIILIGIIGFIEAGAAVVYFFKVPQQQQDALEIALGIKNIDHSVLRYKAHPYFNFTGNPDFQFANGSLAHNALGFRNNQCCKGEVPEDSIRIIAIGGSTTFGWRFSFPKNVWPALLEKQLEHSRKHPFEVINMGMPYYTTFEQLGVLSMLVPEFSPHIVLFHMGLNDAFTVGYQDEGGPDNRYFRHPYNFHPLPQWAKTAMQTSYLFRVIGMQLASQEGFLPGDMAAVIQYATPPTEVLKQNVQVATGKYFHRNMKTLVALAKHMGATPVFINMPLNPKYESGQDVYHTEITKAVQRNNHISKKIAEEDGLLYVDLYSRMRDPSFFTDAAHANNKGMAMKAFLVHQELVKNLSKLNMPQFPAQH